MLILRSSLAKTRRLAQALSQFQKFSVSMSLAFEFSSEDEML